MPKCALPEGFDDEAAGTGTDWDNWLQKRIPKHWFAFGPRCSQGWTWTVFPFPFVLLFPLAWIALRLTHCHLSAWWLAWPALPIPVRRQWRELPVALLDCGCSRLEFSDGSKAEAWNSHAVAFPWTPRPAAFYVSAIQYWSRASFQLHWPLFVAGHVYFAKPPKFPDRPAGDIPVLFFRIGARRDADRVFWWPSFYVGLRWN